VEQSRSKSGQEFSPGVGMSASLGSMVLDHVEVKYQPIKGGLKRLARAANVTAPTARNWLRRICAPQADNLGELAINDPEFKAKLISWLDNNA
jgi:hypothetical protein